MKVDGCHVSGFPLLHRPHFTLLFQGTTIKKALWATQAFHHSHLPKVASVKGDDNHWSSLGDELFHYTLINPTTKEEEVVEPKVLHAM